MYSVIVPKFGSGVLSGFVKKILNDQVVSKNLSPKFDAKTLMSEVDEAVRLKLQPPDYLNEPQMQKREKEEADEETR
ncbi:hypothetical protein ACI3PL_29515, partial [Lacticaseibacillus paracasei]